MIFRNYKHYKNNENNENNENNKNNENNENEYKFVKIECIICLENKNNNEYNIRLNLNNDYYKTCNCNVYIHISCLNKWYLMTKSCPICRNEIIKNTENLYIHSFLKKKQLIINKLVNNYCFFLIINTILKILYFIQFIIFIKFISIIYNIIKIQDY